jgi:hypothetical protein
MNVEHGRRIVCQGVKTRGPQIVQLKKASLILREIDPWNALWGMDAGHRTLDSQPFLLQG